MTAKKKGRLNAPLFSLAWCQAALDLRLAAVLRLAAFGFLGFLGFISSAAVAHD